MFLRYPVYITETLRKEAKLMSTGPVTSGDFNEINGTGV